MTYKLSKYNLFFKRSRCVVCVNLFARVIFGLSEGHYLLLLTYKEKLNNLKNINLDFFKLMYKLNIIISCNDNEITKLKQFNKNQIEDANTYHLIINPTMNCNFSCWYCYEQKHDSSMNPTVYENVRQHIMHIIKCGNTSIFHLSWFGGEPLLYWKQIILPLTEFAKKLCDYNKIKFQLSITTNGYFFNNKIIEFLKKYGHIGIQITLDGNEYSHNSIRYNRCSTVKGSYNRIVKNIINILDNIPNQLVTVRINVTNDNLLQCTDIIDSFPTEYRGRIKIIPVQVWQDRKKKIISIKQLYRIKVNFRENGYLVEMFGWNNKGYTCYADRMNQATINYDGNIFKCTARNFSEENKEGLLNDNGEIVWNDNKVRQRYKIPSFDNEKCLKCKYLPICFGDCIQKAFIDEVSQDHKDYCENKNAWKEKIQFRINEFYRSGLTIDSL